MADTDQELNALLDLYIEMVPGTHQYQKNHRIAKLREVRAKVETRKDFIEKATQYMKGCPPGWVECRNGDCAPTPGDCNDET